jgi:hypothetical protein
VGGGIKVDFFKTLESWCAVGLITFFFIPWVELFDFWVFNGFQAANLSSEFSVVFSLSLFVIPILGFVILYQGARNLLTKWLLLFSGLYPFGLLLIVYILYGDSFSPLSGAYLTLVISFIFIVLSLTKYKHK